jgi:D-alanyl-lipoteichoic acid acyltransferase DltB (MBOAT superfamily)
MLFNSFPFLFVFLPVCLAGYFGLARLGAPRLANLWLALASLGFYGYWQYAPPGGGEAARVYPYVALLCASTALNYLAGARLQQRPRRGVLALGIGANLAVLGYYKYAAFGVRTFDRLFGAHHAVPQIILPLAISFYTFTQIAFLVDAYRGLAREMSFSRYCLFVFFFPHLIAGPIVHHAEIMPPFARPEMKRWLPANVAAALCWLSLGLFKKVAIADSFAPLANAVYAHSGAVTSLKAWAGVLAYAFQLYFDFSGYSDMAIGLALFFNVRLPDNFDAPYRAADIVDFWRRWHITLSRFLRDYLYFPLGGNRRGPVRRHVNLLITMLLGGIWHGAGWQFLFWGLYHGLLLVGCHLWKTLRRPLPASLSRALTFAAVLLGWALFRARSLTQAGEILGAMLRPATARWHDLPSGLQLGHLAALAGMLLFVNLAPTTKQWIENRPLTPVRALAMALLFSVALLFMRVVQLHLARSEFIYFQF